MSSIRSYDANQHTEIKYLYTENEHMKTKLKNAIPFIKKMKFLGINPTKQVLDLVNENYEILIKEIKEDFNNWKDIPGSWIGRLHIIKMLILSPLIYKFSTTLTNILASFLVDIDELILKFI